MEKTVGEIGILNSDLFSDQFFLQCRSLYSYKCKSKKWKLFNFFPLLTRIEKNRISFVSPQPNTHRYDYQVYSSEISESISTIAA